MNNQFTRRSFVRNAGIAGVTLGGLTILNADSKTTGKTLKLGLVGCGGRGRGAVNNCVAAGKMLGVNIQPVAVGDWFENKAMGTGKQFSVPENQRFWGADAYHKVLESDANIVILATPPGFRPIHFEAAVAAGKHLFIEKPVAVDPPGVRRIIAAGKEAKKKGLAVVAGTQRRHTSSYRTNEFKIRHGAIGKILNGQVFWCSRVPWIRNRAENQSDADYMVNNWLNWNCLSGDHICEQHIHNLDVANWFIGRTPVTALGFGGRARRTTGDMFDFFSIDYDYGEGCHVHSMCRQIANCYSRVGESFTGTDGSVQGGGKIIEGKKIDAELPKFTGGNGMVVEHYDLINSILKDQPLNESETVANSTLTAIMGRISAYTGQMVRWIDLTQNKKSPFYNMMLKPTAEDFEAGRVTVPKEDVVPVPGK